MDTRTNKSPSAYYPIISILQNLWGTDEQIYHQVELLLHSLSLSNYNLATITYQTTECKWNGYQNTSPRKVVDNLADGQI